MSPGMRGSPIIFFGKDTVFSLFAFRTPLRIRILDRGGRNCQN